MSIHITKHSGKMEGFSSISTNSMTNPYCTKMSKCLTSICNKCYSNRLLKIRKGLYDKLELNSKILSKGVIEMSEIPIINKLYFRFNSFGDLINKIHLINLMRIVKKNPNTTFTLWTKRIHLVKGMIKPNNFILIYSNPIMDNKDIKIPNKIFDKIFNVYSKKYAQENNIQINCKQSCLDCLICYTHNSINIINEELK
jgi:hypothetical protein